MTTTSTAETGAPGASAAGAGRPAGASGTARAAAAARRRPATGGRRSAGSPRSAGTPRGAGSPRSAGDRRTTRERLLAAAVRVLQDEGLAAVSTTRLTQEVGIVQSGFYSHFPSVDACLAEAAALVVEEIRTPVRAWMAELRQQEPAAEALVQERLTAHFVRVLQVLGPRWPFVDLLERYRRTPGPLGEALAALHAELVRDVRDYLRDLWREDGLSPRKHGTRLDLLAALVVELVVTAAEVLHGSRRQSSAVAAEALALATDRLVVGSMESARRAEGRSPVT